MKCKKSTYIFIKDTPHGFEGALSKREQMVQTAVEIELIALDRGLQFAHDIGIAELVVESDSTEVVQVIHSDDGHLTRYGHLVEEIKERLRRFQQVSISHTRREGNMVAHLTAAHALNIDSELVWLEDQKPVWLMM